MYTTRIDQYIERSYWAIRAFNNEIKSPHSEASHFSDMIPSEINNIFVMSYVLATYQEDLPDMNHASISNQ